jgi:hypothetical protein
MNKLKCLLLLPVVSVWAQNPAVILEHRTTDATYISRQALHLPSSISKSKSMKMPVGYNSVQVNTDGDGLNIVGDAANEPSMAVNPLNPMQIAIGWRQFNTVSNSFRQAGRSYSTDGGKTWNFQEVFEPGVFRSDPVLAANADGVFYYQSLKVVFDSQGSDEVFSIDQWTSFDGGVTWVDKTPAFGGDKSWFVIDKSDGLNRGNIYAAWNVAGNQFFPNTYNSSLDNGLSFTQPITIPQKPVFGTVEIGPNGEVYVFGVSGFNSQQSSGIPFLIKSTEPNTANPEFSMVKSVNMGGALAFRSFINPVGLAGQLYVRVDKSNRATRGNIYLLGSMELTEGASPLSVMFVRSTDGGNNFSFFKTLGKDSAPSWKWFATSAIAANGRLDVIWYDTVEDDGTAGDALTSRIYYTYSYDGGVTFAKEQVISPRFKNRIGYPRQNKMGDYIDMVSDNRGAHIVYTATYNEEQDVYYLYAKPSAIEENPDFPTIMASNAWTTLGVPSQGILATTLINNGNPQNPLLAFETIFTTKPDGTPIWLLATGELPKFADTFTVPLFMPTGDLTDDSQAILAIGTMTKKRLRDENNDLIDNKIEYEFDMSDAVKQQLKETLGNQYDEDFYNNNPFHNINKTLVFDSILPREQIREDLCNMHGQVIVSAGEKNEGRVQYTFKRNGVLEIFAADFTYLKSIDAQGNASIVLDEAGLATPIWQVLQSDAKGVLADNSVSNRVFTPNGGLGFFAQGAETGITEIGTEQVQVDGSQLFTIKADKTTEIMSVLANNAYCGDVP